MEATEPQFDLEPYEGFIRSIVAKMANRLPSSVPREDLMAFGWLGLYEARNRWDPSHGAQFHTFAWYRVRGAILDGARSLCGLRKSTIRAITAQQGADLAIEDLDTQGPDSVPKRQAMAVQRLGMVQLMSQIGESGISDVNDERATCPDEECARKEDLKRQKAALSRLRAALPKLEPDRRRLLELVYVAGLSMTKVGEILKIHKSNVSRAHGKALDELAILMAKNFWTSEMSRNSPR